MTDASFSNSYDQVPYTSLSHRDSHPDNLATIATLFGMQPVPIDRCRVLELGCAGGGNLIPIAYGLPESEFVGIDYSAHQIAQGQATVDVLELENITLEQRNILDVDPAFGQFDYIIAHGIYSWVPLDVQDRLLRTCKQNLSPNGVAYVSYNTYPGWHMMGIVRDIMLYHTRQITEPQERAAKARALIQFLANSVPETNKAYGAFLEVYNNSLNEQRETAKGSDDSFILHDELEEVNDPIYFHQFIERATDLGLQYLAEAQYFRTQPNDFQPKVREALAQLSRDRVDFEQHMDFLRNQTFRQTLLCHQDISLSYKLDSERFSSFYVASRAQPESPEPDIRSVSVVKFCGPDGITISTDHPVSKAAMLHLRRICPQAVHFDTLLTTARAELGLDSDPDSLDADRQALAMNALTAYGYSSNLIELHVHAPSFTLDIGKRPVAYPVASLQAHDRATVTNVRHERVRLDGFSRYLLLYLDGQHDRQALVNQFMSGPVADGTLKLEHEGQPVSDKDQLEDLLSKELEIHLQWLAQAALLIASDGAN